VRAAGFALPRSSDDAVRLAISRILQWLPTRVSPQDDLRLPAGSAPAVDAPSRP
jgi:hypothetical protein